MKYWFAGLVLACAGLAGIAPAHAESHFKAIRYLRLGVSLSEQGQSLTSKTQIAPEAASLDSDDDRNWQFTASGCVYNVVTTGYTDDDLIFQKSFEAGFAEAGNANHDVLRLTAKAVVVRQLPNAPDTSVICDAKRIYWLSVASSPLAPGKPIVTVLSLNGYVGQDTEQMVVLFDPTTFLKGEDKTADQLGDVTAGIAKAIGQ